MGVIDAGHGATQTAMEPTFFATPDDFRAWLEAHHESAPELLVGFYKKGCGKPSITWPESVDEALCFGWIDGIRRTIDDESYSIRFTPRRARSIWSKVNVGRVAALKKLGRMRPAGLRAFAKLDENRSGIYRYEHELREEEPPLARAYIATFKANKKAWTFFAAQPPGYRKLATRFVMDAKKEETRLKRLERLIKDSVAGRRIGLLARPEPKK
jgi:uncharacterized protein YdeI (YjbR/CyaY-like superfamily)